MKNDLYDQINLPGRKLTDEERYRQGKEESLTAAQICLGGIIALCLLGAAAKLIAEAGKIIADILA